MVKNHIIGTKTLPGLDSDIENPFFGLDSITDYDGVKKSEIEFILSLVLHGIQNKIGECEYEGSYLTWKFTGEMDMSLANTLEKEFYTELQKNHINAIVKIKEYQKNKMEVWVVHKAQTLLETDIQVNSIFRTMEERYPNIDMSLFMATEKELDGHEIISS